MGGLTPPEISVPRVDFDILLGFDSRNEALSEGETIRSSAAVGQAEGSGGCEKLDQ